MAHKVVPEIDSHTKYTHNNCSQVVIACIAIRPFEKRRAWYTPPPAALALCAFHIDHRSYNLITTREETTCPFLRKGQNKMYHVLQLYLEDHKREKTLKTERIFEGMNALN